MAGRPKPIASLALSTQKRLRARGETDATRLAKWQASLPKLEDLSPAYRKRLERKKITDQERASGISMAKARGHKNTEILSRFKQLGGYKHVNKDNFNAMGKPEQAFIAEMYILGFMTPSDPLGSESTQEMKDARNAFLGWKDLNDKEWDEEDWNAYKQDYRIKFSSK